MHTIYLEPELHQRNLARFAGRQQTTDLVYTSLTGANSHRGYKYHTFLCDRMQ